MQEGAIQGWLETIDTKKKIIKDKETRCDQLEAENGALQTKNADLTKRMKRLELDLAEANNTVREKDGELMAHKRLNESMAAQKDALEKQIREEELKEKNKEKKIEQLSRELADERVAKCEAETQTDEARRALETALRLNNEL